MSELTTSNVQKIESVAELFAPLKLAAEVAREALAIQQATSDQRRLLEEGARELTRLKAETLELAQKAVAAEAAFHAQIEEYERLTEDARRALGVAREAHAEAVKAQAAEYADARSELRKLHASTVDAMNAEIDTLRGVRDSLTAEVERLKARFA